MSLEGAKIICLNADEDGKFETIFASGKSFKFGYYMDCDVVLEHPDAMGVHCVINCDAFGRVTIENRCSDQLITLDGKSLVKMRPLLHNTEICILDKKYLWHFDGTPAFRGFQMEDANDFTTPKQIKKPQHPPNSEPGRKWGRPLQKRLTIHSFAYCIKAGESPKDVESTSDENKPLNTYDVTDASSPPQPTEISNFIDLNTPKFEQSSCSRKVQPLSVCKLSEIVITSYSPRETGMRQEKSFAIVQSPLAVSCMKTTADVSLGPFHHNVTPHIIQNYRSSMHLIDLITPKKLKPPTSSPSRTLLKSTLKRNIPKGTSPQTPQKLKKIINVSTPGSSNTVYSVRSTDDESVIILSDDCSDSSSPITKTPPRARTPQSLMKRAILSSAKKVAVKKCLNQTGSKQAYTPMTSKNPTSVRLQSQSTPQRKSFEKFSSSAESVSVGKTRRSLVTSTPFRQRTEIASPSASRRSLLLSSQSSGANKETRNSIMLKQALSITSTNPSMTPKRKLVSRIKNQKEVRKSVSFLEQEEKIGDLEMIANQSLNDTFTINDDEKNVSKSGQEAKSYIKNVTFSPKKDKLSLSPQNLSIQTPSTPETRALEYKSDLDLITSCSEKPNKADEYKDQAELMHSSPIVSHVDTLPDNRKLIRTTFREKQSINGENRDQQSFQSTKHLSKINDSVKEKQRDYDFDGVDEIFKTPKAKDVMILSSPKSISLQKASSDSVELIHSTEFNLSANLDILFQTPQSEFVTRRVDSTTPGTTERIEALSPEEAFDVLVGRPILKRSYARKTTPKKQQELKIPRDPNLPKSDIEEWIDNVNEVLEIPQEEKEMSYLTSTMSDISRDPLLTHSVPESSNTKKRMEILNTQRDESEMTMTTEDENKFLPIVLLKDPLESTVPRSLSPNISGISLLDHTSESIFSETLVLSDDASVKETEKSTKPFQDNYQTNLSVNPKQLNESQEDKARKEIEEAFTNFENERKALNEKRLASTPDAKKQSISIFCNREYMVNQSSLDPTFELEELGKQASQHKKAKNLMELELKQNKDHRITLESTLLSEVKLDGQVAKAERELELAFENFEEEPEFSEHRVIKTPEPKKVALIDHRRTLASTLVWDVKLDLQAAKAERELELAFENFEEEPESSEKREVKTPEPKKVAPKDHRRTLGSTIVSDVKLDLQAAKAERELELAFENFEEEPEFSEKREVKTPEPKKVAFKEHRRILGSALVSDVKLDLQAAKAEREFELAFENFEEEPEFSEKREVKTPEPKKVAPKDHRRTLGSTIVSDVKLDLQAAKAERELELAFENFEEEPEFSEKRVVKTPEPKKVAPKDHRRTLGSTIASDVKLDLQAAKAERELELAFENFEEEPEFSEKRVVKTPEPKKVAPKDHRRTLGSTIASDVKLDLQAAKAERELELAFENFEEEPEFSEKREVKTPEPKKIAFKEHRRTLGSALVSDVKLDLQAAKAERELELAFENFEEEPEFSEKREVKTPEPKKVAFKEQRRTLGSALVSNVKLDLQAAKAEREFELAFENFEEEPEFSEKREVKTPEPKKVAPKDHRRTLGSTIVSDVKLDLQAAKAERELELAFENFEEEPEFSEKRVVKTPEPKKVAPKDHRRTLGSTIASDVKLDLQAAKAERELELAFENFEEEPEFSEKREVKTPEPKKIAFKEHRRTLGSALVSDVKLDLQAAKAERELELAFENFEEEPEFSEKREVKTPEPKKVAFKEQRRTLGSALVSNVKLDLQAAKAEREFELAFENFEEEPEFSEKREVKTPEPKKVAPKDHRRTLGSTIVSDVKLDLQAAKAERELELAFENFEEEPEFSEKRVVKTPEPKKVAPKDHRRTLGSTIVSDVKLDLQAAKAERELELAFENFEEEPEFSEKREVKTPEPKKIAFKEHRRTLGSALVSDVKLDLQAAKAEREFELAFENFEEEPEFSEKREVKTPEPKKVAPKDHRRTLGSTIVSDVKLDLQAAKAERELELAFENFEEEPEFSEKREVKTPEPKKVAFKEHRRTLGSALVSDVKLDLQAAKAERELELAFENFEEEPEFSEKREVKTPEPKKVAFKEQRRTLGSALVSDVKLDLQAAKAEREFELAFENFEEEPEFSEKREVKTPEPKKVAPKDHRRTLGSTIVSDVKLDLQAAKAERELELAFENFEEEPEFSEKREVKTPEPKKVAFKEHRRTLGSALVSDVKLDLQAAKAERELELAFENFEEEPEFSEKREVKTPEPKKVAFKEQRRTLGSALVSNVKLDLQAAKAEREFELAFENFEEEPEFSEKRVVKTPEPKKVAFKEHRRTLGSALVSDVKLDLQAAKAERELELAFENFEEEPEFSEKREVKTPEPKKVAFKEQRRTLGSALVSNVKLDLQAAKAERELELAFENFEEEPEFSEKREVKTPELKKVAPKDHRRTLGSTIVSDVKLDLQAAKAERELELAFENFEEEPEFSEKREVKTPEPKKVAPKDHRRTLGSTIVSDVKLDLQAAKAERELELAFENFEEEPEFSEKRVVKTPEPKKVAFKEHRRTLGSALVSDVKLDLQAAKAERELELAFENFEEEPEFSEKREVKTPELKKVAPKDHRRTLGSTIVSDVKLDLQAAKAERELELAFENFEEEPEFSEKRVVKTPEPKKVAFKEHRRTLGSALVSDVKLDLQAAKAERELELAFENFEEEPEFSEKREVKTPELKKVAPKDHRRTLGSTIVSDVKLDLQAAKAERELELAFENFEEEPEFSEKREVKTPELKKVAPKDHRRTLGSTIVSDVKLDLQAAKAEREFKLAFENSEEEPKFSEQWVVTGTDSTNVTVKEHEISKATTFVSENKNRQINKFENYTIKETYEFDENIGLKDSNDSSKQIISCSPKMTDEDYQLKLNLNAVEHPEPTNTSLIKNKIIKTPVVRRTRRKAIDNLECSVAEGAMSNFQNKIPQTRRTRQNSINLLNDDTKTANRLHKKASAATINDDESMQTSTIEEGSADVDSIEAESIDILQSSHRKRKLTSKISETCLKEKKTEYLNLAPIDKEEANLKIPNQDIEPKTMITLRAQTDEIISLSPMTSRSRIRGRKAQLNVVLVESKHLNTPVKNIKIIENSNSKVECNNDVDEFIPSTPLPLNPRGRKPSETAALKRTRRGNVQQDLEGQTCDTEEDGDDLDIVLSTPLEKKTRRRQGNRKAFNTSAQVDSEHSKTKAVECKEFENLISIEGIGEASETENLTQIQSSVKCEKVNMEENNTSSSLSFRTHGEKENVSENQTIIQLQSTSGKNVPQQKIISIAIEASSPVQEENQALFKVKLEKESSTPKKRIVRRRLAETTGILTDCTHEDEIIIKATQDDDKFVLKEVEIASSEIKSINSKDLTLDVSHTKTPQIACNRRVGRSKANVLFQEKIENENNASGDVEQNIQLTTRSRRAAVKLENEVVKNSRKRNAKQIIETRLLKVDKNEENVKLIIQEDCQVDLKHQEENIEHVVDVEKLVTADSLRKRGCKANVGLEPEAIIKTSQIDDTTYCTDETPFQEHVNDDGIVKTDESLSPILLKSQEIQNRNQTDPDVVNNIPTRKRGGRAAVKSDKVVPALKSTRNKVNQQMPETPQLEKIVQDVHKRGRKATPKIEPTVSTPLEHPILKSEEPVAMLDKEEVQINQLSQNSRSHKDTLELMHNKPIIESSTPIRRGARRNVQNLSESKKNIAEVHEEVVESSPLTRRAKRTRGINVQNALMESNVEISQSAGNRANQRFDVVDKVKCLENNIELSADKGNLTSHTEPHPIKLERLSTESSPPRQKTRQKRAAVQKLCSDKIESDAVNERSTTDANTLETISAKKRTRKTPSKLAGFVVNNLVPQIKTEILDNEYTQENSTPVLKRSRRAIVKNDHKNDSALSRSAGRQGKPMDELTLSHDQQNDVTPELVLNEEKTEERYIGKSTSRIRTFSEMTTPSTTVSEDQKSELDTRTQNKSTRGRGRAQLKTNSKLESSDNSVPSALVTMKCGQQKSVEIQNDELTQEDSTPTQKRSFRAIAKNNKEKESDLPRKVGRHVKTKDESDRTLNEDLKSNTHENNISCNLDSAEDKTEEHSKESSCCLVKAILGAASPSVSKSDDQQTEIEIKTQNKPTRGRGRAPLKNNSTLESTLKNKEDPSLSTTKQRSTRGRKAGTKTKSDEIALEKISDVELTSNSKLETNQNKSKEKIDTSPKKIRKAGAAEPVTRTTRGRKAVLKDISEESNGPEPEKDSKSALKRRNLEILTDVNQEDTPSKRTRRKPNKFISDEFVT